MAKRGRNKSPKRFYPDPNSTYYLRTGIKPGKKSIFDTCPELMKEMERLSPDIGLTAEEIVNKLNAFAEEKKLGVNVNLNHVFHHRPQIVKRLEDGIKNQLLNQSALEKIGESIKDSSNLQVIKTLHTLVATMSTMQAFTLSQDGAHLPQDISNLEEIQKRQAVAESFVRQLEGITRAEKNIKGMLTQAREDAAAAAEQALKETGASAEQIKAVRIAIVDPKDASRN